MEMVQLFVKSWLEMFAVLLTKHMFDATYTPGNKRHTGVLTYVHWSNCSQPYGRALLTYNNICYKCQLWTSASVCLGNWTE